MRGEYQTLLIDRPDEHVLVIAINRPEAANALDSRVAKELQEIFRSLQHEPDLARCVVLTGSGERVFSAGGDLKERNGMSDHEWERHHALFERVFRDIVECPVPVLAAVNGAAFGGGLELALCCDLIYAARGARFALTEVTLGIMPGGFGTQTLPRVVGPARAKEIIFSGMPFAAEEALTWGLVNQLSEPTHVLSDAISLARRIAANAPLSVRQAKLSIHHGGQMDFRTATFFEIEAYGRLVRTEDRIEGVRAFNEKRAPNFQGR
jgi:enoyl-CoA hydratase